MTAKPKTAKKASAKKTTTNDTHLIMFTGDECPHCDNMMTPVKKLEKELGVHITKKEVWHNEENNKELRAVDNGKCGGVPFFYNKKNKKWICGECDYAELKRWAR